MYYAKGVVHQELETNRHFSCQVLIVSGKYWHLHCECHVMSIISEYTFTALYNTVLLFCCSTVLCYQPTQLLEFVCGAKLTQAEGH